MKTSRVVPVILLALLSACESERTIPTRAKPDGETIKCVGISEKGKQPGIDYDWSVGNAVAAIVGFELIVPPLMVLHHETFCPIADTTKALPRPV